MHIAVLFITYYYYQLLSNLKQELNYKLNTEILKIISLSLWSKVIENIYVQFLN